MKELMETNGGSISLIIAGIVSLAVGVIAGVEVADYYMK